MKHPQIKISIPEPCHENWNEMTPTQKGRFCGVCTKEVFDFTSNSDEEIVKHFQQNENICGRFYTSQLDRKLIVNRKKRNHWISYAASLLLPMALFSQEAKKDAKQTPKTTQTNSSTYTSLNIGSLHKQGEVAIKTKNDSLTVSGIISDDTGYPLPGATITIKGTNKKIFTDFDGIYKIDVQKNDVLVVSYPGYKSSEIKVTQNKYDVSLELDNSLEEIQVVAGYGVVRGKVTGAVTTVNAEDIENRIDLSKSFFRVQFSLIN